MLTDSHGPLTGVRVIDASRVLAGPFCGQMLGDLGAEVLKIERPGIGDETRGWGPPFVGDLSAYFLACNRNKRALALDLAQPAGRDLLYQLVARSDILLENFRAASAEKLGLDADRLWQANPRLIICSITGFGRTGPLSELPGYDFAIQALSGLMSITGPAEGPPCKVGVAVADILTGLHAAVAALACLHARQTSGHGYLIDLALLDCAVTTQVNVAQAFLSSGKVPARQGNAHLQIVPYQLFATADGWLVLAVGNDGQWQRFCTAAERPDLAADPRFTTNRQRVELRQTLVPLIEAIMRGRPTREWVQRLQEADVTHAPVQDYAALFSHPDLTSRGLKVTVQDPRGQPVDLLGSPFQIQGTTLPAPTMPPRLGEHTERILGELLGLGGEQIAELRRQGVVG